MGMPNCGRSLQFLNHGSHGWSFEPWFFSDWLNHEMHENNEKGFRKLMEAVDGPAAHPNPIPI
jgi:hypothetical protein